MGAAGWPFHVGRTRDQALLGGCVRWTSLHASRWMDEGPWRSAGESCGDEEERGRLAARLIIELRGKWGVEMWMGRAWGKEVGGAAGVIEEVKCESRMTVRVLGVVYL